MLSSDDDDDARPFFERVQRLCEALLFFSNIYSAVQRIFVYAVQCLKTHPCLGASSCRCACVCGGRVMWQRSRTTRPRVQPICAFARRMSQLDFFPIYCPIGVPVMCVLAWVHVCRIAMVNPRVYVDNQQKGILFLR
jgi:hypothetical protein